MAIRILKTNTEAVDLAINVSCETIYDIEDLLERGPKLLEAHSSLQKILKDMKRGCPIEKSIDRNAVQGCPPGVSLNGNCDRITCQTCWKEWIDVFLERVKERVG